MLPVSQLKLLWDEGYFLLKCNENRWSTVHVILKRYVEIGECLPNVMIEDGDELLLSWKDDHKGENLLDTMSQLDSITL